MYYFNIHTHRLPFASLDTNIFSIYNLSECDILERLFPIAKNTRYSCGIHPWDVEKTTISIEKLRECLLNNGVIAVGEVGLDKYVDVSFEKQVKCFEKQIVLAQELNYPLIIHCVKAWDELIQLYKKYSTDIPWILHGFRGGKQQAEQLQKLGFKFSFGEKYNVDALRIIEPDNLFLETDDSLVSIVNIYDSVVGELSCDISFLSTKIEQNVSRMFGLSKKY